jgi:hypothetical protein
LKTATVTPAGGSGRATMKVSCGSTHLATKSGTSPFVEHVCLMHFLLSVGSRFS